MDLRSDNSNNFACPKYVFVLYQNDTTAQFTWSRDGPHGHDRYYSIF